MDFELDNWLVGDTAARFSGLYISSPDQKAVPLKAMKVKAIVYCEAAFVDVRETDHYEAENDCNVVFKFPLPTRSAMYRFQATFGNKVIKTEVKLKAEAVAEFPEQSQDGSLFSIELGNLPAGQACELDFGYVRKLERVDDSLEFVHAATWVPPYASALEAFPLDARLEPDDTPALATKATYTLSYQVHVVSHARITAITSPSHGEALQRGGESDMAVLMADGAEEQTVLLSEEVADPSKDFTLLVDLEGVGSSSLLLQECQRAGRTKTILQACFVPPTTPPTANPVGEAMPPAAASAASPAGEAAAIGNSAGACAAAEQKAQAGKMPTPKREVWFVVDCSRSMWGEPEAHARDAAAFFVKDLPCDQGTQFNIVTFGSTYRWWGRTARTYTEQNAKQAVSWINQNVNAKMGNAEILNTLQAIYAEPIRPGCFRDIIFLTNGGTSAPEELRLFDLVAKRLPGRSMLTLNQRVSPEAQKTTVYCLGIGPDAHHSLLDGIAERSGGIAQYVASNADIGPKAGFLMRCALAPDALRAPRLLSRSCVLRPVPAALPPRIFPGQPLMVLAEVVRAEEGAAIGLEAERPDGSKEVLYLPLAEAARLPGEALAVLHAMSYISELLGGTSSLYLRPDGSRQHWPPAKNAVVDEVVRVGLEEGLVTPHTAAVGVLLRADPLDPSKTENVEVPLQVPHGRRPAGAAAPPIRFCAEVGSVGTGYALSSGPQYDTLLAATCAAPAPVGGCFQLQSASFSGSPVQLGGSIQPHRAAPPPPPPPPPQTSFGSTMRAAHSAGGGRDNMGALSSESGTGHQLSAGAVHNSPPAAFGAGGACAAPQPRRTAAAPPPPPPLPQNNFRSTLPAAEQDYAGRTGSVEEGDMDDVEEDCASCSLFDDHESHQGKKQAAGQKLDARVVLRALNDLRTIQGCWTPSPQLSAVLACKPKNLNPLAPPPELPAAPQGLGPNAWATVLVLAFLRRHLANEKALWEGMAAKALGWLKANWPAGVQPGPGAQVIAAIKVV